MDEDVIKILLGIPLWEVTNLDQPSGVGDKKILREVSEKNFSIDLLVHLMWTEEDAVRLLMLVSQTVNVDQTLNCFPILCAMKGCRIAWFV